VAQRHLPAVLRSVRRQWQRPPFINPCSFWPNFPLPSWQHWVSWIYYVQRRTLGARSCRIAIATPTPAVMRRSWRADHLRQVPDGQQSGVYGRLPVGQVSRL